jgi:hypothetical protein
MPNSIEIPKNIKFKKNDGLETRLRNKESEGTLPYDEFINLIENDIQSQFTRFPGLQSSFNYIEELRKLAGSKEMDKILKKEKLKELQSKHLSQVQGMSYCRTIIERIIDQKPDISVTELKKYLERFGSYYGIPDFKLEEYGSILNKFEENRQNINSVLEQHPNSEILVQHILNQYNFQLSESTPFQLDSNAYSLIIYTSPETINTLIPGAAGIQNSINFFINERNTKNKDIEGSRFVTHNPEKIFTVPFIIIPFEDKGSIFKKHEIEHVKNSFWMEKTLQYVYLNFSNMIDQTIQDLKDYRKEILIYEKLQRLLSLDKENKEVIDREISEIEKNMTGSLDSLKNRIIFSIYEAYFIALESAKDEIIAMKKDGDSDYFSVLGEGPYDYLNLSYYMDRLIDDLAINGFHTLITQVPDVKSLLKNHINASSNSFDELVSKGGFTTDEAIAVLSFYPLYSWPTTVANLIQNLKNNK